MKKSNWTFFLNKFFNKFELCIVKLNKKKTKHYQTID